MYIFHNLAIESGLGLDLGLEMPSLNICLETKTLIPGIETKTFRTELECF